MHVPTTSALLNIWEQGLHQSLVDRALSLLAAVFPDVPMETLAAMSIGERDSYLFEVRRLLFGSQLANTAHCPKCSERLEWESDLAELSVRTGDSTPREFEYHFESFHLKYRLPSSADMHALAELDVDRETQRNALVQRCLLEVKAEEGESTAVEQLPAELRRGLIQEMERTDAQSNIQFDLICPGCGHAWEVVFDIVSFLWAEINNWAERMLRSVHILARAYGWREQDILAMSPIRKQIYLDMVMQ